MGSNKTVLWITNVGIGTALYVVLGCALNIPLLAGTHLQTDLGYIVFAYYLYLYGYKATPIGVLGCLIESLITSGFVPIGWMLAQLYIGIICGYKYKNSDNKFIDITITVNSLFVGIAGIKTLIECILFNIPLEVKFTKNCAACFADLIPMLIGLYIAYYVKKNILSKQKIDIKI